MVGSLHSFIGGSADSTALNSVSYMTSWLLISTRKTLFWRLLSSRYYIPRVSATMKGISFLALFSNFSLSSGKSPYWIASYFGQLWIYLDLLMTARSPKYWCKNSNCLFTLIYLLRYSLFTDCTLVKFFLLKFIPFIIWEWGIWSSIDFNLLYNESSVEIQAVTLGSVPSDSKMPLCAPASNSAPSSMLYVIFMNCVY